MLFFARDEQPPGHKHQNPTADLLVSTELSGWSVTRELWRNNAITLIDVKARRIDSKQKERIGGVFGGTAEEESFIADLGAIPNTYCWDLYLLLGLALPPDLLRSAPDTTLDSLLFLPSQCFYYSNVVRSWCWAQQKVSET